MAKMPPEFPHDFVAFGDAAHQFEELTPLRERGAQACDIELCWALKDGPRQRAAIPLFERHTVTSEEPAYLKSKLTVAVEQQQGVFAR
jgi:hypothetical protein